MFTLRWYSGEVDRHTFYDVGSSHVDDSTCVAMPKPAMPCFNIGDSRCVEGGVGVIGWRDDAGSEEGKKV